MSKLTTTTLAAVAQLSVRIPGTDISAPDYTSAELASCRTFMLGMYTPHGVATKWNRCDELHKRPASVKTIERWMRKGPITKNVNFETWLIELAKDEGWVPPMAKVLTLSEQLKLLADRIDCISDDTGAAMVMGIVGFANELRRRNVPVAYSRNQADIIRTTFHKHNTG